MIPRKITKTPQRAGARRGVDAVGSDEKRSQPPLISYGDESGCASGASSGRLCDDLFLFGDWPCELLGGTLTVIEPRRSGIDRKEDDIT